MNKLNLEDYIRKHRDDFDYLEPSDKVWERLEKNGKKKKVFLLNPVIYKVAAMVALVSLIYAIAVRTNIIGTWKRTGNKNPEINELLEAEAFYARQVNGKLDEIRKCYILYPELKNEVENDLDELETMYNNLKKDLGENMASRVVIEAMIENSRNRLKLVDEVLEQIEC